jgi:tetratricopeptide (TPR) repeat protein
LGDLRVSALALNFLSLTAIQLDRLEEAHAFIQESLELCKQVGDRWGLGTAYRHWALVSLAQENISEALTHLRESLNLFTELGAQWDITRSLIVLGEAYLAAEEPSEARQTYLDALRQAMEVQAAPLALEALSGLAQWHLQAGEAEQALLLAYFILGHAAGTQETKARAGRLRSQAEAKLTPPQIGTICQQASADSLETILAKIG